MANGIWKLGRRGGTQLPLVIVAVLAVVLILLGKAQSSIFDRARASVTDWMAPALQSIRQPVQGMQSWVGSIGEVFTVYQQNLKLKQENARLRQWQNAALVLESRVKRYQLLLNAVPDPKLSYRLAHVIGRASKPFLETMILDAGKSQGVKPGQAVVDPGGMIGRVFLAGDRTSWVILLTDLNSRIPVMIEPEHAHAIMAGDNTLAPTIDTLSQGAQIKAGDQVVTSGDGGLLPPGLPVGTIVTQGGGFRVALLADPSTTEDAEIVDYQTALEQVPSVTPGDMPASVAGMPPAVPQPPVTIAPPPPAAIPGMPAAGNASASHQAVPGAAPRANQPGAQQTSPPQKTDDDNEDHPE
ncbi:MAG TPA: rod shape-determining protein MreC [Rhizomicrobium sp.]|jgi:rod shape-determining protein MreC|nr:rod shape-determining protein MreC [Rhizomicrobium sp.]